MAAYSSSLPTALGARRLDPACADETGELYERYGAQILGFCLRRLGSREEAEDAAQSTFLNAQRGLQRGVAPEYEAAWLYKIALNVCRARRRAAWRRRRVETPSDLTAIQDSRAAREREADELIELPHALGAMSEQQRAVILLREWQGLSYREIAHRLELSQSAVETLLFRARRSLARALTDDARSPARRTRTAPRRGRRFPRRPAFPRGDEP
jgi:RNA polymerase sigma-70 factor (ECF subfamily)